MIFALRIGWYVWRMPGLDRRTLPDFLERAARVRSGRSVEIGRIQRWRRRWLRVPGLRNRNTCYMRALVLFRFFDAATSGAEMRFHLGAEPPRRERDVPHGHAWVTLDGREVEPMPAEVRERVRELYCFPAVEEAGRIGASVA